ncbi:MAG: lytic transglycosylase domain-containing protein [Bacteroidetes bacterium]|nr:lytic transglycosylase domain-containing protein [Bacteroidota bacterium]
MMRLLIGILAFSLVQTANAGVLAKDQCCSALVTIGMATANNNSAAGPVISHVGKSHRAFTGNIFERRLDSIKKDVPMDYNEYVQSYIDAYLGQRDELSRVIGLAKYYFPIYEKAFRDEGIPEEIKYLSIVESRLDPYAVSRVGATGPWQFMTNTAQLYGLVMNDYVDERRDPIRSSYAAAAYLKGAYEQFGDWLLAIAAYNCGTDNVMHAIEKAGVADFWAIREYLPVETRGYVPQYIAVAYIMNYYRKYNIQPQHFNFSAHADTVMVDKCVSLASVSKALGVDLSQLTLLNPSYKKMVLNGTPQSPQRLILPPASWDKYGALYDVLNNTASASLNGANPTPDQSWMDERQPIHMRTRKFDKLASEKKPADNDVRITKS